MPYLTGVVTPQDYGAVGDGVTDDTAAVQAAITAVNTAGGGVLYLPNTYAVTPVSSTVAALTMNNGTTGYTGVRLVGAGNGTGLKKLGNGPLIDMSGPASDTTGATHCTYCSLETMHLSGGGFTGPLVRTYYADDLLFFDTVFANNADIMHDSAEFWDTRFIDCVWLSGGSSTSNASTPNVLLRNSAAASGFGFSSTGVTNEIYFYGCRWEGFHTGALWAEQGVSSSAQVTGVYLTDCKMESIVINGGPHLIVDNTCKDINAKHLYCYSGGFNGAYSTANDVIQFSPYFGTLDDVYINNASASATVANGVTVNAPNAANTVVLNNVRGTYTTAVTGAHLHFGGTNTGAYAINNVYATSGTQVSGTIPTQYGANPPLLLSSGSVTDGAFATTPLDGTLAVDTLNKRLWARQSSGTWARIPLNTIAASVTSTTTVTASGSSTLQASGSTAANEPQAGSVYVMEGSGVFTATGSQTITFTLYWGTISGTSIAATPALTPIALTNASFSYKCLVTFRSTTSLTATIQLDIDTSLATDAATRYTVTPSSATTVTTSSATPITMGVTWSATGSSISLMNGYAAKLN